MKLSKRAAYEDISLDVVRNGFGEIYDLLRYIFNNSLEKGVFPYTFKITKVYPVFKARETEDLNNYLCFPVSPKCLKNNVLPS